MLVGELSNGFPPPQGLTTSAHQTLLKDGIARQGGKEGEGLVSGQEMHQPKKPDPYLRVMMLGWAHLAKIEGHPTFEEVVTLKDEDLKAAIR